MRISTVASAAVTEVHSPVVVAPALTPGRLVAAATTGVAGVASATSALNGTSANSIAIFEGRAGTVAANLGIVLFGAVAVMVL